MTTSTEREKYEGIYNSASGKRYGHKNHGKNFIPFIKEWQPKSLVDIGCGYNEFVKETKLLGIDSIGVDFACRDADIIADAKNLPFENKKFDVLTSFDMLEHLLPSEVKIVLKEFSRVSNRFVFSISYQPSVWKWKGQTLHPTVMPEEWWICRIVELGGTHIKKIGRYITGNWTESNIFPKPSNCCLVGNGPSAIYGNHGKDIDSFDEVIRFNAFDTLGFEAHVGTKTTLWSTFGRGVVPANNKKPDRAIYIHGENGTPSLDVKKVFFIPRFIFNHLTYVIRKKNENSQNNIIPSSGLLVCWWLLNVVEVEKIYLIGFDHFQKDNNKRHHYWEPKAFGKPKEHSSDIEHSMFSEWNKQGRVVYLESHSTINKL